MTTTPAAHHLRQIATIWTDLQDALGAATQHSWPPVTLRGYLNALEQYDANEATALRALERDPAQIGERPVPINLRILDTMRVVEAALVEYADQIAAAGQRQPMQPAPATWPTGDRIRRNQLAAKDAADPQRWAFTGRRTAVRAALWLCARVEGLRWPGPPLTEEQHQHVARVAAGALQRIEAALDLATGTRELARPCPCGGIITVQGGGGAGALAHCPHCGAIWTENGVIAA